MMRCWLVMTSVVGGEELVGDEVLVGDVKCGWWRGVGW